MSKSHLLSILAASLFAVTPGCVTDENGDYDEVEIVDIDAELAAGAGKSDVISSLDAKLRGMICPYKHESISIAKVIGNAGAGCAAGLAIGLVAAGTLSPFACVAGTGGELLKDAVREGTGQAVELYCSKKVDNKLVKATIRVKKA